MSFHSPDFWNDDGRRPYTGLDWLEGNKEVLAPGFCYAANGWGVIASAVTMLDLEQILEQKLGAKKAQSPDIAMVFIPYPKRAPGFPPL